VGVMTGMGLNLEEGNWGYSIWQCEMFLAVTG
jgi:hypothetical protein